MSIQSQFEKEEEWIIESEARGEISKEEARKQIREIQRDYIASAEEAAQDAYNTEMGRW